MPKKSPPMKKKPGRPCVTPGRTSFALAVLAALALSLGLSAMAHAQEPVPDPVPTYHWTDPVRFSLGVGGGYAFHSGEDANLPTHRKEWEVGGFAAYNIVPGLSAAFYVVRGFENRTWRAGLGPRLSVWRSEDKNHAASVSLRYAWHAGPPDELPAFKHEWEAGAEYGFAFSPKVVLGASSAFGLDSHTFRSALGARYRLF
jgi:hypothetical protein